MNELAIKRHSFELAKERLKKFSEKAADELEIDKVETEGGFLWLGDHKVTGYELNRRLETIQKHFIAVNTTNNKVIKEFREVYNVLDVLDKDYINSIVANVAAIGKTSDDVRKQQATLREHNVKLATQQNKLQAQQTEINKSIENNNKIIEVLKKYNERLEGYKHLRDVDKIWNDCKSIQNEIRVVSDNMTKISKKATEDIKSFKEFFCQLSEEIETTANLLDDQIPVIEEAASFTEQLKSVSHLNDVDFMWDDMEKTKKNLAIAENRLQNIAEGILKIQKHLEEIDSIITILNGCTHLQDIDSMWNDLDNLATVSAKHTESITTLFESVANAEEYAMDSRNSIIKLETFKEEVSAINHLKDVDEIWKQTEEHQFRINRTEQEINFHVNKLNELVQEKARICEDIDANVRDINCLKEYKEKLGEFSHLGDVDNMWKDVREHTFQFTEIEKRDEELAIAIQKNKDELDKKIADAVQIANVSVESLTKRIKYAYWIAGGSVGIAITELILILLKVI